MREPLYLKSPAPGARTGPDPAVAERVSEMLLAIERAGVDAVRAYSRDLDGWDPPSFEVTSDQIAAASDSLPAGLKQSIEFAQAQIRNFAELQRATLTDFEAETLPGVFLGQRQVPVSSVGAYCPSGRVPMLACAFMTVLVPKVAGVETVIACSPPRAGELHAPTLHSIATSGADRIFALGGVQALAAMAFGLLDGVDAVDMIVGPGNAFVAEAKRQLFGRVGIDLLAGHDEHHAQLKGSRRRSLPCARPIERAGQPLSAKRKVVPGRLTRVREAALPLRLRAAHGERVVQFDLIQRRLPAVRGEVDSAVRGLGVCERVDVPLCQPRR
jgi:Histidinol dehydrogenase